MEDAHRKLIKDNIDKLVSKIELKSLLELCVKTRLISAIMQNNLYEHFPDENARHKQLFIKITQRGPKAFNLLMDILKTEFPAAEKILCPDDEFQSIHEKKREEGYVSKNNVNNDNVLSIPQYIQFDEDDSRLKLEIYTKPVKHNLPCEVIKSVKFHYAEGVGTYAMCNKYRGVLLLANIIDFPAHKRREGAEIDRENMIYLFREFGFEVFYYENLRLAEFRSILVNLLDSNFTKRTESFVMAILSHGEMVTGSERVRFHDGNFMYLSEILEYFSNPACPNLSGKPKICIFPFCRGDIPDRGVFDQLNRKIAFTDGIDTRKTFNSATLSDIIILYATVPGFQTHRDPDKGSWYVQVMCEVWAKHAHNTDIEVLEKMVGNETGKIRANDALQTSSRVTYGFHKALYFNPGYFRENK